MSKCVLLAMFGLVSLLSSPNPVWAWGKEGHEIVGIIADKHLSENARKIITELLKDDQFKSLSDGRLPNWADLIRPSAMYQKKFPKMAMWHYIDIPIEPALDTLKPEEIFKPEDNVAGAIRRFAAVLKDPEQPIQERRYALFFLAHFIGDLHQPLHCANRNDDKGGNLVKVITPGSDKEVINLHKLWDTEMVLATMGKLSIPDFADRQINALTPEKRKEYQQGTVEDWILESHKIARLRIYLEKGKEIGKGTEEEPLRFSVEYTTSGSELAREQMTKGGLRLAQFLNDLLK